MRRSTGLYKYFKKTAQYFHININHIYASGGRKQDYVRVREYLSYFLRINLNLPYKIIHTAYGYKDHSTIFNHIENFKLFKDDDEYEKYVNFMLDIDNKEVVNITRDLVSRYLSIKEIRIDRVLSSCYGNVMNATLKEKIIKQIR